MNPGGNQLRQRRVWIPFLLASLIWGSTWLVITGQLGEVPATWSVAYRFAIGAVAMFAYARLATGSIRLDRHGHCFALLFGIPQFCFNFNAVYMAEQYVTSGLVAVVYTLLIVPNAVFAWLFLGHRITGRFLLGSSVAIAGVALLFVQELRADPAGADAIIPGIGLTLCGALSASIANIVQATDRIRAHSLPAMIAWGMTYGVVANAGIAWIVYGPPVLDPRPSYWLGLAYLGLIASALVFSLYFPLVRTIGPGRAAYTSLVIPIIAMLLSSIFEDYVWTPLAAAGGVLALIGLFIALRPGPKPTQPIARTSAGA